MVINRDNFIRCVFIFSWILGNAFMAISQNLPDSLFNRAKEHYETQNFDSCFVLSQEAIGAYHEVNDWKSAKIVFSFILKLPYKDGLIEEFNRFIEAQQGVIRSTDPNYAANLKRYPAAWSSMNGKYEKAIEYLTLASDELHVLQDTQYLYYIYFMLGQNVQFSRSDGPQSLRYVEQAESVYSKKKKQSTRFLGSLEYLKGVATRSFDEEKAIYHFKKAQELRGDPDGLYENFITKALLSLNRNEEALQSAQKSLKTYEDRYEVKNGEYMIYEAMALSNLKQYDKAIATIDMAFKNLGMYYSPPEPNYIKVFYYKARILEQAGYYQRALDNCQQIFSLSIPSYKSKSLADVPDILGVTPNQWVLEAMKKQGEILIQLYQNSKDSEYLSLALETYNKGISDVEIRRRSMESWSSKEQYNQYLFGMYEDALMASALLYNIDPSVENKNHVIRFLQKSRATLLQEKEQENIAKEKIPTDILDGEKAILESIADIETQILKNQKGNNAEIKELKYKAFYFFQELDKYKKKNSKYYSTFQFKRQEDLAIEIIENLPEKTAVIAYQVGEDEILSIGLTKDEMYVLLNPLDDEFEDHLFEMRQTLSNWDETLGNRNKSEKTINKSAQFLSNTLLPVVHKFQDLPEQIVIIPDGDLNGIPFELLTVKGDEKPMLHKYDLSYAYLLSSLPGSMAKERESSSFAGFAPKYSIDSNDKEQVDFSNSKLIALRDGLLDIPEARKSVTYLTRRYSGESWIENQATKANFIAEAGKFDVLHLGMHSELNNHTSSLSSLIFSGEQDNELYLREIQSMDIPASLVVLSACNTGVGRNVVGEGPFSLARAFFHAGTKSTLMSLWQVPDNQTSRIMKLFYQNIEAGQNKSKALNQAKRDYLKTASILESHPSFWSGFVLVGDSSPISLDQRQGLIYTYLKYFLIISIILLVLWTLKKKWNLLS